MTASALQYYELDMKLLVVVGGLFCVLLVGALVFTALCSKDAGFLTGAFAVSVLGIALSALSFSGLTSRGLSRAGRVVSANSGGQWDLSSLLESLKIAGVFIAIAGVAGVTAARKKNAKILTAFYLLSTIAFGGSFIGLGAGLLSFVEETTPQITRQVHDMCQAETYKQLYKAMQCTPESSGNSPGIASGLVADSKIKPCEGTCQDRAQLLGDMGGCSMLTYLCSRQSFGLLDSNGMLWQRDAETNPFVSSGVCLLGAKTKPPMVWLSQRPRPSEARMMSTLDFCREICNRDKECTAINLFPSAKECAIVSPNNPDWATPTVDGEPKVPHWKRIKPKEDEGEIADPLLSKYGLDTPVEVKPGDIYSPITTVYPDPNVECYTKLTTRIITRLLKYASGLAGVLLFVGSILCFSTLHGLLLFMGRRRRSKDEPEVGELAYAMFCPCCPGADDLMVSAGEQPLRTPSDRDSDGDPME
ncbi:unnamed protein product [Amoebophrya sp. A25]|nr:unnamed protein product [Amoebophrya sp. A25]|eukprot:GSA25T00006009001.1